MGNNVDLGFFPVAYTLNIARVAIIDVGVLGNISTSFTTLLVEFTPLRSETIGSF